MPETAPGNTPQFVLFGAQHLLAIALVLLANVPLIALLRLTARRPAGPAVRLNTCYLFATALLVSWFSGQFHELALGTWSVTESLPLHLCDIGVFVTAAALYGAARPRPASPRPTGAERARSTAGVSGTTQLLYELAYFWGLGGTLQAVLTPDVIEPFPDFTSVRFFITHGGIVVGVLVMTFGLRMRPWPGAVVRVWVLTLALALVVMAINWLLGSNYMYLCGPPRRASLFDYFGPWPWSLLTLIGVGTVFFMLWYSPFWIADRLQRGRQ